jgi:Zn-dependent protease/predicted transcriptional regulator
MAGSDNPGDGIVNMRWILGRVRGVPVYVGPSVLLLAALFTWWLGTDFVQFPLFDGAPVIAWLSAAVTTLLFLGCIFLHEVGHAVTSLDRDVEVRSISLFLLGGVTESVGEPRSARDEIVIVGIGPLISLVAGAAFGLLVWVLPDFSVPELIAGWLAWMNCAMAVFNLVPGYPLDGGRLLRAVLWLATSSRYRATRLAASVGLVFATMLIAGAVLSLVDLPLGDLPRSLRIALGWLSVLGLWGGLIGYFLLRSSIDAYRAARLRERLGRTRVRELMGSVPPTVPADVNLDDLVVRLQQRPSILWPVGRPLLGGVKLEDLDRVPRGEWSRTNVTDVLARDVFVDADTPMDEALDLLSAARDRMLIVVRHGEPVGLLTPSLVPDVAT